MADAGGLAAAAGAVLLFGSFPLAIKTTPTGDGVTFQFCMCAGIYTVGAVAHLVQCSLSASCPTFVPLASVGGAIWCASNLLLVPIVDCIGIGLAMMAWGMNEMLAGFLTGRFGLFGVTPEPVTSPALNSVGVSLAVASLLVLVAVRPNTVDGGAGGPAGGGAADEGERASLLRKHVDVVAVGESGGDVPPSLPGGAAAHAVGERKWTDRLSPRTRRVGGLLACVVAGFLSGSTFTPPQAVVDAQAAWLAGGSEGAPPYPGASTALSDLLFSHFSGIMLASTMFVMLYAAATRNRPQVYAQSLLPAYVSGLVWGCAMVCWFIANARLSLVIAFPIVTMGPGLVNMLWGVVLFKEVTGARNFALLAVSVALYGAASAAIVVSKS